MPYTPPELSALLQNKPVKELIPDETQTHLTLAEQLCVFIQFIADQKEKPTHDESTLQKSLMGANIFVLEMISEEYYFHSPELKKGYIYNSGSPLYSFVAKGIEQNKLTPRDKLIYLNKFFKFISDNENELEPLLKSPFTVKELKTKMLDMLANILAALTTDIANVVNAVPTEESVTKHMGSLVQNYQGQKELQIKSSWYYYLFGSPKPNAERIKQAQLDQLIATIECEDETDLPAKAFSRSQRIKIGALLALMQTLEAECWFTPKSKLYLEGKKILNNLSVENLDATQKLACLSSFHSFINSHHERANLEKEARKQFKQNNLLVNMDDELNRLSEHLSRMEDRLRHASSSSWPVATAMGNVGAMIGSAPGYGFGSAMGFAADQTQSFNPIKSIVGTAAGNMANVIFKSTSAGYFAFVMGDFIVGSTLTRAFAKVFECIGKHIGRAAGFGAGAIFDVTFDLSYKGFRGVCTRFLNYCDLHPVQMRNADRALIECLLELPANLFPEDKQHKIRYALGEEEFVVVDTHAVQSPTFKSS